MADGNGNVKTQTCGLCSRKKVIHGKDKDLWICRKCDSAGG